MQIGKRKILIPGIILIFLLVFIFIFKFLIPPKKLPQVQLPSQIEEKSQEILLKEALEKTTGRELAEEKAMTILK